MYCIPDPLPLFFNQKIKLCRRHETNAPKLVANIGRLRLTVVVVKVGRRLKLSKQQKKAEKMGNSHIVTCAHTEKKKGLF